MEYDVFISYSRKDSHQVDIFINAIQKEGFTVWYDKDGIESGDAFKSKIVSAIESSKVFLFFSSVNSNESEWTKKEVGIANARKKPIIPIKLDDTLYSRDIEFDLINLDYVDCTDASQQDVAMTKLVKAIRYRTGNNPTPNSGDGDVATHRNKKSSKRGCVVTISIVVCLLLFVVPNMHLFKGTCKSPSHSKPSFEEPSFEEIPQGVECAPNKAAQKKNKKTKADTVILKEDFYIDDYECSACIDVDDSICNELDDEDDY